MNVEEETPGTVKCLLGAGGGTFVTRCGEETFGQTLRPAFISIPVVHITLFGAGRLVFLSDLRDRVPSGLWRVLSLFLSLSQCCRLPSSVCANGHERRITDLPLQPGAVQVFPLVIGKGLISGAT